MGRASLNKDVEEVLDEIVETESEGRYQNFRNLIRDFCNTVGSDDAEWTGVSDNYSPVVEPKMLESEEEILYWAAKNNGELRMVSALEDLTIKKSAAHDVSNELIDEGFLEKINQMPKIVAITAKGYDKLINTPALPLADTEYNADDSPIQRVHNVTVKYNVPETASFEEEWKNKIIRRSNREWEYQEEKNTHFAYFSKMTVEVTDDAILFHIRKPYRGYERSKLQDEMISDAVDCLRELEERNLSSHDDKLYDDEHLSEFEVVQMEVAIENHPTATLLVEDLESLEDIHLTELSHRAEDGERVFVDTSPGEGEIEGTGIGVRGRIDGLWRLTKDFWLHPKTWLSLPGRMVKLEKKTSQVEETADKNKRILEKIADLIEEEL
jgi:hypothetical protein